MLTAPAPECVNVADHFGLARMFARRYTAALGGDYDEAYGTCLFALVRAARTWDSGVARFSTYAGRCMRNALHLAIERQQRRDGIARQYRIFGKYAPPDQRHQQSHSYFAVSLFQPLGDDDDAGTLLDLIIDETAVDPETVLAAKQEADTSRQRVAATLSVLNDRERRIVEARFLADEPATLEALGAELGGVSKERIRQIEEKALAKLKLALTGQPQRPRFVPRPQLPYPPTAAELARLNPRERRVAEGRLIPGARITLRSLADEFGVAEPSISFAEARAYEKIMAWRASEDCSVALAMG